MNEEELLAWAEEYCQYFSDVSAETLNHFIHWVFAKNVES